MWTNLSRITNPLTKDFWESAHTFYISCILGMMKLANICFEVFLYLMIWYLKAETLKIISSFTGSIHGWTRLEALWWTTIRPGIFFTAPFTLLNLESPSQYCFFLWFIQRRWMSLDSFLVSSALVYMHIIRSSGGNNSKTKKSQSKTWVASSDHKGSMRKRLREALI